MVSEDSFIGNGDRAATYIHPGSTCILLNGARLGHPSAITGGDTNKVLATYGIGGTLLFGTPEHPLTRDLVFDAALYRQDRIDPKASPSQRSFGASIVLGELGRMVVNSADPAKARVIFRARSRSLPVNEYNLPNVNELAKFTNKVGRRDYAPSAELWQDPRMPTGIAAVFLGQTDFNGVVFDGFYEGGIIVSPEARAKWKNVSFGDENLAKPEDLFVAP